MANTFSQNDPLILTFNFRVLFVIGNGTFQIIHFLGILLVSKQVCFKFFDYIIKAS